MDKPDYASKVFAEHLKCAGLPQRLDKPFVVLELGPGDSLLTALLAQAHGASRSLLVDVGPFAADDLGIYQRAARWLKQQGLPIPDISGAHSIPSMLLSCNATYATNGLASLREIPDASVDLVFSQAVLEHVRRREFEDVLFELRRILKPSGVGSHEVDLADHLGGGLNNLRFSEKVWEADWMARSGFYTNRIRYQEMLGHFDRTGFDAKVTSLTRWGTMPTPRQRMSARFAKLPDDDLLVRAFNVVLRPR
jgi:SAM-dependent methyltransferase